MSIPALRRRAHYILSSHWDREWYQTFQDYRYRLVKLFDKVLTRLESGELVGPFTCDGQAIILEDYLEIRPERESQIRQFLAEGKLVAGPWYVLPDEFLVSGESMIRNIRMGRELTRKMGGKPSNAGFVCDLFGHCSQLPQIFRQFGMPAAVVWRGVDPLADARFWWVGADGVEMPSVRFGKSGYGEYPFKVRQSFKPEVEFDATKALADLRNYLEEEGNRNGATGPLLLFDGGDHLEQDIEHYQVLLQEAKNPENKFAIIHSTLDAYFAEVIESFGEVSHRIKGELREPGLKPQGEDQQWLIPGVGSSRVWIKQANARCQSLLCQWAEPFSVMAAKLTGFEYPEQYLQVAWKWLLQNHPHDSICGCSIDQVHEDMKYRFSQCQQIAERLTEEALIRISAKVEGEVGERELRVSVFNPVPQERDEVIEMTLAIPREWPEFNEFFGFEPKSAFRIFDAAGGEIPYQRLGQKRESTCTRIRDIKFPEAYPVCEVTMALRVKLPALGYTTLKVVGDKRKDEESKIPTFIAPTRYPLHPGLAVSERSLENENVSVTVESNGSLTLLDKRNGQTYTRLMTFEDGVDIGDGWYHGPAVNDQHFTSTACAADVAIIANGSQLATLRVRTVMRIPRAFEFTRMARGEEFVDLVLDNLVTLRAGQDCVEVVTKVVNTTKDHRLRVLFPSGAQGAETFLADSAFDVVKRPITLRQDNHLYRELEVEAKPQQSWTAVHNQKRGLAVVCDGGLLESGVRDVPDRPIILTLFRSTGKTVLTSGEKEGQLLGREMTFRYRIVPFSGDPEPTEFFSHAQKLSGGIKMIQLDAKDLRLNRKGETIPASYSLMELKGKAVLTSLRQVDKSMECRMFNPISEVQKITLTGDAIKATSQATTVDFESKPSSIPLDKTKASVSLSLAAKQVQTLAIV
jgi:alpha-mannosidase